MQQDTYFSFEGYTADLVKDLMKEINCPNNLEMDQNGSPTVREFLELSEQYPKTTYIGYSIRKPRSDYRVSIDGFYTQGLTAEQALDLMELYGYADERSSQKMEDGTYSVRFWWD